MNNSLEVLHQLPPKKRLDAIINHPTPMKLVRSMATHDLLLTIRDLGGESSLELVEMLHPTQVQEIFDLEIWSNDRLNIEAAGQYFSLLFAANRDTAITQIHGMDIELIGLMFKMVTEIYDTSLGEEPIDFPDLYTVSPGGRFIVCFVEKEGYAGLAQSLHSYIEELYGRDMKFVLRLLESVRFELASSLEEESMRFRQNRLLDMGILPQEERLQYFSPIQENDIKRIFFRPTPPDNTQPESLLPIRAINRNIDERYPFAKAALVDCSEQSLELFWNELMHAVLNMHASLSGDFGDREEMTVVGDYVKYLLELGLMQVCQGQMEKAATTLEQTSIKYLIRLGRTTLTALRRRLTEKTKDQYYLFGPNYCHVDTPLREVAQAITLPEPRYYEGLMDPKKLNVRYFATHLELAATVHAVSEVIFRAEIVGKRGLGFDDESVKSSTNLSHANILARSLVNSFNGVSNLLADIPDRSLQHLFDQNRQISPDFRQFADNFGKTLADRLATNLGQDKQEVLEKTRRFLTAIFIQFEQNFRLLLG